MDRVEALNPVSGKKGTRILKWKYDVVKAVILSVLPQDEPGLPFKDLAGRVKEAIPPDVRSELGSIGWYTTTVKLDLEARGAIARVQGARPQRLVKVP